MREIIIVLLIIIAVVAVVGVGSGTGPNCPGMDPGYLGFCE